jgi:hypothetical protein
MRNSGSNAVSNASRRPVTEPSHIVRVERPSLMADSRYFTLKTACHTVTSSVSNACAQPQYPKENSPTRSFIALRSVTREAGDDE